MAARSNKGTLPGTGQLWAAWFVAVTAWGVHLFASYGLVEWYCNNPGVLEPLTLKLQLHGLTVVCFAVAVFGGWLGWDGWRKLRRRAKGPKAKEPKAKEPRVRDPRGGRSRFMVVSGMMLSGFLAMVILVEGIPNFVFEPCL